MPQYIVLDCKKCSHYTACKIPCVYVDTLANGNTSRREPLIEPDILDDMQQQDYKISLAELMDDRRYRDSERLEIIRNISDWRTRMIASAALAHIPQRQIAKIINHSQSTISIIYRKVKR